jgi:hypothetical protein
MFEFIPSPNFTPAAQVRTYFGQPRTIRVGVGHWWGAPSSRPTIEGVIAWFQNPKSQVSAHLVINDHRSVQMVNWGDAAWHARQANPFSIGIELDPNGGEAMYRRAAAAIRYLRGLFGDLPLEGHNKYVNTQCPGHIDLAKLDRYAREENKPEWQRNYKPVEAQQLTVLVPQTPVVDLRNGTGLKMLSHGTQIDFVAKTTVGGVEYYISSYAASHGLPNGIRKTDVGIPQAPPPEPPKPEIPEFEKGLTDIADVPMWAHADTELVEFSTGKIITSYKRGQKFDIAAKTTFLGKEFYITVYSFTNRGKVSLKGIPADALKPVEPVDPSPVQDEELVDLKEIMSLLQKIIAIVARLISRKEVK